MQRTDRVGEARCYYRLVSNISLFHTSHSIVLSKDYTRDTGHFSLLIVQLRNSVAKKQIAYLLSTDIAYFYAVAKDPAAVSSTQIETVLMYTQKPNC